MSEKSKRALALLGTLLGLLLGARLAGGMWQSWTVKRAEALTLSSRLSEARARIAGREATRDSLTVALADFIALAPRLVTGSTRAEAAAALSSTLSGLAAGHVLRVRRVESLADSASGALQPVAIRAELEGDISGVVALIAAVETHAWVLSIGEIRIAALDPAATGQAREVLRLELCISGWFHARRGE